MDKRKSPGSGDALQLHLDRQKKMMEHDRKVLNLLKTNQDVTFSHTPKKNHQDNV